MGARTSGRRNRRSQFPPPILQPTAFSNRPTSDPTAADQTLQLRGEIIPFPSNQALMPRPLVIRTRRTVCSRKPCNQRQKESYSPLCGNPGPGNCMHSPSGRTCRRERGLSTPIVVSGQPRLHALRKGSSRQRTGEDSLGSDLRLVGRERSQNVAHQPTGRGGDVEPVRPV